MRNLAKGLGCLFVVLLLIAGISWFIVVFPFIFLIILLLSIVIVMAEDIGKIDN